MQTRRPQDSFFFLLNDERIADEVAARGLAAHFIHQNAFIDETLFAPNLDEELIYDAVMIARLNRFKRHHLASQIPKTLLISSVICEEDEATYGAELQKIMPKAVITGDHADFLPPSEIVKLLTQSKVALILSDLEGGNYATTEYLLCGLPVISTGNLGGRNEWLDPDFCRIVAPDPASVASAVQELSEAQIDPMEIRGRTLKKMTSHRQKLFQIGQQIYSSTGTARDFARDFYDEFLPKLGTWDDSEKVMERFNALPQPNQPTH